MIYELYTEAGEQLANKLIEEICAHVEADYLTRKQAMERITDAIAKIKVIDGGMCDAEPHYAICQRVNRSFRKAGYVEIDEL